MSDNPLEKFQELRDWYEKATPEERNYSYLLRMLARELAKLSDTAHVHHRLVLSGLIGGSKIVRAISTEDRLSGNPALLKLTIEAIDQETFDRYLAADNSVGIDELSTLEARASKATKH